MVRVYKLYFIFCPIIAIVFSINFKSLFLQFSTQITPPNNNHIWF